MSFTNLLGHEAAIRLLKGQLAHDRLAHTTLFVGSQGIGKRTLALELAKAVECQQLRAGESCEQCESCEEINQSSLTQSDSVAEKRARPHGRSFPDLMIVSPDSDSETGQVKIDQVRALINWMALTPYQGRKRIGVIEEADHLTEEAAHACLKLLEEPPENGFLILIATGTQRLPTTLISRCHVIRCVPQGIQRVALYLREKEGVDEKGATLLATLAGGRLGTALEFHRKNRHAVKNEVVDQLVTAWRQRMLEVPFGSASRLEIEEGLEWLAAWWRDLIVLALEGESPWIIHQDRLEDLRRHRGAFSQLGLEEFVEKFLEMLDYTYGAQGAIQRNVSPRIALASLLSR